MAAVTGTDLDASYEDMSPENGYHDNNYDQNGYVNNSEESSGQFDNAVDTYTIQAGGGGNAAMMMTHDNNSNDGVASESSQGVIDLEPSEFKDKGSEKENQLEGSDGDDSRKRSRTSKERESKDLQPRHARASPSPAKDPAKFKEREERLRLARERLGAEQAKKLEELQETQRRNQEFRERQERERRAKLEELRRRDEQHRAQLEERKKRMMTEERARKQALLKRLSERHSKVEHLHSRRGGASSGSYAFGSSTDRMHRSYMDVSGRTQSQGCLSGGAPGGGSALDGSGMAASYHGHLSVAGGGGGGGLGHGSGTPLDTSLASDSGALKPGRRATSSLGLARRSSKHGTGQSSPRTQAKLDSSTLSSRRSVSTTHLANQNKRNKKAEPSMSGPPGTTVSMADLSTGSHSAPPGKMRKSQGGELSRRSRADLQHSVQRLSTPRKPPPPAPQPMSLGTAPGASAAAGGTERGRRTSPKPNRRAKSAATEGVGAERGKPTTGAPPPPKIILSKTAAANELKPKGVKREQTAPNKGPLRAVHKPPDITEKKPADTHVQKASVKSTALKTSNSKSKEDIQKKENQEKKEVAAKKEAVPKKEKVAVQKKEVAQKKEVSAKKEAPAKEAKKPPIPKPPRQKAAAKPKENKDSATSATEKAEKKPTPTKKTKATSTTSKPTAPKAGVKNKTQDATKKEDAAQAEASQVVPEPEVTTKSITEPESETTESGQFSSAQSEASTLKEQPVQALSGEDGPGEGDDDGVTEAQDEHVAEEDIDALSRESTMGSEPTEEVQDDEEGEEGQFDDREDGEEGEEVQEGEEQVVEGEEEAQEEVEDVEEAEEVVEEEEKDQLEAGEDRGQASPREAWPEEQPEEQTESLSQQNEPAEAEEASKQGIHEADSPVPEAMTAVAEEASKQRASTPEVPKPAAVEAIKDTPKGTPKSKSKTGTPAKGDDTPSKSAKQLEAEAAKAKLAEKRREARERAQREAEEKAWREEEERRLEAECLARQAEEERRAEEEMLRLAEEARRAEKERLQRAIEQNERLLEEEERKKEQERLQREEEERQWREELERRGREAEERALKEEVDRLARKKRLEMIMARTRAKGDAGSSSSSSSAASPTKSPPGGSTPAEEAPAPGQSAADADREVATIETAQNSTPRAASPVENADTRAATVVPAVSNLISEDTATSAPKFKSPILQQMLGKGRLKLSTDNLNRESSGTNMSERSSPDSMRQSLADSLDAAGSEDSSYDTAAAPAGVAHKPVQFALNADDAREPLLGSQQSSLAAERAIATESRVSESGEVHSEQEVSDMGSISDSDRNVAINKDTVLTPVGNVNGQNESETNVHDGDHVSGQNESETITPEEVLLEETSGEPNSLVSKDSLLDMSAGQKDTSSVIGSGISSLETSNQQQYAPVGDLVDFDTVVQTTSSEQQLSSTAQDSQAHSPVSNGLAAVNGGRSHPESPASHYEASDVEMTENGQDSPAKGENALQFLDNAPSKEKLASLQPHDVINSNVENGDHGNSFSPLVSLDDNNALIQHNNVPAKGGNTDLLL